MSQSEASNICQKGIIKYYIGFLKIPHHFLKVKKVNKNPKPKFYLVNASVCWILKLISCWSNCLRTFSISSRSFCVSFCKSAWKWKKQNKHLIWRNFSPTWQIKPIWYWLILISKLLIQHHSLPWILLLLQLFSYSVPIHY